MKKENKRNENKGMDIVFLLDRSGSMSGSEEDTIGGYNSYLDKQRNNKSSTYVTTVLFDDKYEVLHEREEIDKVKNLSNKQYYVRGCTALLDAIGKTISRLDRKVGNNKVLFVITTDGLENASKEFSKEQVKSLIEKHNNWEFLYIGADIDSYSEGVKLGIKKNNIANYKKSKKGINNLFNAVSDACMCMESGDSLGSSWKRKLENYVEDNQE